MKAGWLSATITALTAFTQAHPTSKNITGVEGGDPGYDNDLPIVDLGYEKHQAIAFNQTGDYYNFSNIRYAEPPTGRARWSPPRKPHPNLDSVQNGSIPRVCPQANPAWELTAVQFIPQYLAGLGASSAKVKRATEFTQAELDAAEMQEDCLFLDVFSPRKIFDSPDDGRSGAPVLVWIHGGGYVAGSKTNSGDPAGLIRRSNNAVVFVSINYRLGAFGWLSGNGFHRDGGVPNAALYDQRFALEWVRDHISDFGGDPDRVTVMGESAGGGSIMHQITAFGGQGKVPFSQAVPQSPGFLPIVGEEQQLATYNDFLSLTGVTNLAAARNLSSAEVINANIYQVAVAPYGTFVYGPAVDGYFVPDLPGRLIKRGSYYKNVNVMVGHNANEGLLFTSPTLKTDQDIKNALKIALPSINNVTLDYVLDVLYPAAAFRDTTQRAALIQAELGFVCNTFYLNEAFQNQTYAYKFAIFPALHGQDVDYTFYNNGGLSGIDLASDNFGIASVDAALTLQEWIVSFTIDGKPRSVVKGTPPFPKYGPNAQALQINNGSTTLITDDAANERCRWWQEGRFFYDNGK